MFHEQAQHQEQIPVAVVASAAEAELVATTLKVSGIEATFTLASVIPSLEWADGHAISVPDERVAEAVELLRGLGHQPLERPGPPPAL